MASRYKVYRGDTFQLNFEVSLSGAPYDLTGCTLYFTIKRSFSSDDTDALVQKISGDGIVHTPVGQATLTVEAELMDDLPINRALRYDIQLKDATDAIYTLDRGYIVVQPEVTRTVA